MPERRIWFKLEPMTEYHYGQFGPEHLKAIRAGLELFNAQKYWECHEELEDHWLDDVGDNARFVYWALIQAATALYHYREGNLAGAQGMLAKALDKLERCEEKRVETKLLYTSLSWEKFKTLLRAIPLEAELKDFNDLYDFRFETPKTWE